MMTTTRISRLLLIAMLASLTLSSCGGSETTTDTTAAGNVDTTTVAADTAETLNLPAKNWEGRKFRVLGYENVNRTQFSNFEIDSEGENGDVVNDAIFRRNTKIEDTYNVEIVQILDASDTNHENATMAHIRQTTLAGEDLYDLAFASVSRIGTLAREGMFYDLNSVDHIDFTKSWWNSEVNSALEVSGRLFFTNSDFSLRDKSRSYIMTFNKAMVEKYELGDPFQLVRDGKWTLDVMTEWSKKVGNDVNGNGEPDYEDTFGTGFESYNTFRTFSFGAGLEILQNNGGSPALVMNNERTIDIIDKVFGLLTPNDYVGTTCELWNGKVTFDYWSACGKLFMEGRLLFLTTFPHSLKTLSANCTEDYGVLPFGKLDEKQDKYYTFADSMGMLFGIPSTTPDPDFSGFMLEALSAESQKTSLPAYYEISCKTKYTYDEDSAEMMDIIFDGIVFEPAVIYGISGVNSLLYEIAKGGTNDFASRYASIEAAAKEDIKKLISDFAAIK